MRNSPPLCRKPTLRLLETAFDYQPLHERSWENEAAVILLKGLYELRNEGIFCDLKIRVGEKTLRVHKNVLASSCPYFRAMLSGRFLESDQEEISIKDIETESLEMMIDFMYTGMLKINSKNAKNLLLTASFLQLNKAEEYCVEFIESQLNNENCIDYLLFAGSNSFKVLVCPSIQVASENFSYISTENQYLDLEFEEFKPLIRKLKKDSHPADDIYSFVMRWIHYSNSTRKMFENHLIDIIDPSLISPEVLQSSDLVNTSNPVVTAWKAAVCVRYESEDRALETMTNPLKIKFFVQSKYRQFRQFFMRTRQLTRRCQ